MRKKIVVIGANSFSGQDFIDLLLEHVSQRMKPNRALLGRSFERVQNGAAATAAAADQADADRWIVVLSMNVRNRHARQRANADAGLFQRVAAGGEV